MTPPLIAINNLEYRYGTTPVLSIDHAVLPGGTTALLGPNGAGKSTLLRMLATVAPAHGSVLVDGADISQPAQRLALRRRLGYAAQQDTLPSRMKVSEYCDYLAALKEIGPRRRRRRWTQWALAEVGLADHERDRISELSGGMRRRLILAQSLLGQPQLLVLDEPLVSLDANHRSLVVKLLATSASSRTTIVATHHADELAAVCQHVVVMAEGNVAFAGTPHQVAAQAVGQVWETSYPLEGPAVRALGPDRFRMVGPQPNGGVAAEPSVHDGYVAIIAAAQVAAARPI